MGNYTVKEKLDATHFLGLAEVIGSIVNYTIITVKLSYIPISTI